VIQHIDVHAVLQESCSGLYADLVTRPTGRVVRERIAQAMATRAAGPAREGEGALLVARMDFSGVGCMDYSCADEIVAKLLQEGATVLLLRGLSEAHREAIEPVLARHGLAVLLERLDGTLDALGPPDAAAELLEQLVAHRLAGRLPGGTFALTVT
jgi:hypothetical protein